MTDKETNSLINKLIKNRDTIDQKEETIYKRMLKYEENGADFLDLNELIKNKRIEDEEKQENYIFKN